MITDSDVINYLEEKFQGVVADNSGIKKRYQNYVKSDHAQHLVAEILQHINKESKILDIGSGWGSFVHLLNSQKFDAYGIEIQEFMVQYARQRLEQSDIKVSVSQQIYHLASALNLPFPDASFDVVTLWNVLEHIEDYETTLTEAIRVLKPNGKLFIKNVNYAFCFMEPHYRVPWLPFLSKKKAVIYLRFLGRDPSYIQNGIFYISNSRIIKILKRSHMYITKHQIEKLSKDNPKIISNTKRILYKIFVFFRMKYLLLSWLKFQVINPFCSYIDVIAIKK